MSVDYILINSLFLLVNLLDYKHMASKSGFRPISKRDVGRYPALGTSQKPRNGTTKLREGWVRIQRKQELYPKVNTK